MRKISEILAVIILFPFYLSSQEVVTYLSGNPVAALFYNNESLSRKSFLATDTLELPFTDDFSGQYVSPDQNLWSDFYAYINPNYPLDPPTVGVATLDALNSDGSHYPDAGTSKYNADSLTSRPINLKLPASDSIYFSFFYQPGGLAEPPETGDSLVLEFYSPVQQSWNKIWSAAGPGKPEPFEQVMIKIEDEIYLRSGFRFRFRNYASQLPNSDLFDKRANVDLWHLDYIRLDKQRSISDTLLRDVAFLGPLKSILKDYSSLPWPHFKEAYNTQREAFIEVIFKNHDNSSRNIGTVLEMRDILKKRPVYRIPPFSNDLSPGDSIHYKFAYNYPFDFADIDSSAFEIKTYLQTDFFDFKANDTLILVQKFFDYYALDDGSAEASYGLRGDGTKDASSALKFFSFKGDTLRAVDIYFAQVVDSLNLDYYFYLNVWDDNNGTPGTLKINQIGMRPEYSESLNLFVRYLLDEPVYLEGSFYIGFTQTTDRLLNVGLDLNNSNKPRIFNNADNGEWKTSVVLPGTPMMRPIFRTGSLPSRIIDTNNHSFLLYPNPADDYVTIEIPGVPEQHRQLTIELFDLCGRMVIRQVGKPFNILETGLLENGIYIIQVKDDSGLKFLSRQLLINH